MPGSLQSDLKSVEKLFRPRLFQIPDYQRAYSWESKHVDDLWEDICEGMRTDTTHFLGTVVLMQDKSHRDTEGRRRDVFQLVDGQQRVTTLCLLLIAVHNRLQENQRPLARGLWTDFIEHEDGLHKLSLGELNRDYFKKLIETARRDQEPPSPSQSLTNARLKKAFQRLKDRLESWVQDEGGNMTDLTGYVRDKLQVLCLFPESRDLAIKTFQTVNDRGKNLSLLDKTKSFLMFYITRYLEENAEVLRNVEKTFGQVFARFDAVKYLAGKFNVDYLTNPRFRFNEDEFLRHAYHYGAKNLIREFSLRNNYNYAITPKRVFEEFVKGACRRLRIEEPRLRDFVVGWCEDLDAVSQSLVNLLDNIPTNPLLEQMFRFQGPSASVYPLLLTANARDILNEEMLNAIAVLDLRVYQVRGTDPKADLYRYAVSMMKTGEANEIYNYIVQYCREFGANQELDRTLRGQVYRQSFVKYVLWQWATADDREINSFDYELYDDCQVDHVLPENPDFDVMDFGFDTGEDFETSKHRFGNLTVLESRLNGRAQNRPPVDKVSIYRRSLLRRNRLLGNRIATNGFERNDQAERLDCIVKFFKQNWEIPMERE